MLCGRYRACHMLSHGAASGHCMVLSLADLSVWCYRCEAYVHNETLTAAKRSAHRSKFGCDLPGGDAANAGPAPLARDGTGWGATGGGGSRL